jgi:hypothetical protein
LGLRERLKLLHDWGNNLPSLVTFSNLGEEKTLVPEDISLHEVDEVGSELPELLGIGQERKLVSLDPVWIFLLADFNPKL